MADFKFHAIFAIFVAPLALAVTTLMDFYSPGVAYKSIATEYAGDIPKPPYN